MFDVPLKNSWLFPAIESLHVIGLALLVGAISLVNFRALGVLGPGVAARSVPWVPWGLGLVFATGPVLFLADTSRYVHNPAFLTKMALLAMAMAFQLGMRRRPATRFTAILSLILWSMVVLGGRAVADFDL